jgi:hypothetical protein
MIAETMSLLSPSADGANSEPGGPAPVVGAGGRWVLHRGDALAVLRAIPDASVDTVITDPPYSSGGFTRGDRSLPPAMKYTMNGTKIERPAFAGDNRDQRSFAYWCALWLGECLRVAKPGAPLCVFTDWRKLPTMTDAVQAGGWVWRPPTPPANLRAADRVAGVVRKRPLPVPRPSHPSGRLGSTGAARTDREMTHYADCAPCDYFGPPALIAVGWLDPAFPYERGDVEDRLVGTLVAMALAPLPVATTAGVHRCGFCRLSGGCGFRYGGRSVPVGASNIFVPADDRLFVAPSMILHYMDAHEYAPPEAFQRAVLACPAPPSVRHPTAVGLAHDAGDVNASGLEIDDEQHKVAHEAPASEHLDAEEVGGRDSAPMGLEEGLPIRPRSCHTPFPS